MKINNITPTTAEQWIKMVEESSKFKSMFVDWELAKRLKNLGFNEPCFAYFWAIKDTFHYTVKYEDHNSLVSRVSTPLWQQVIDWLDSKKIFIDIDHEFGEDWEYRVTPENWKFCVDNGGTGHSGDETIFKTRIEATKHAVNKAIEILEATKK